MRVSNSLLWDHGGIVLALRRVADLRRARAVVLARCAGALALVGACTDDAPSAVTEFTCQSWQRVPAVKVPAQLGSIVGAAELRDGAILVRDENGRAAVVARSNDAALPRVLRVGDGPLELRDATALFPFRAESVLVHDAVRRQVLVLDEAGVPRRAVSWPAAESRANAASTLVPIGVIDGDLIALSPLARRTRSSYPVLRCGGTEFRDCDTLVTLSVAQLQDTPIDFAKPGPRSGLGLRPTSVLGVTRTDGLLAISAESADVYIVSGRALRGVGRLPLPRRGPTDAEWNAVATEDSAKTQQALDVGLRSLQEAGGRLADVPATLRWAQRPARPAWLPLFAHERAVGAFEGSLWVQRFVVPDSAASLVRVDRTGWRDCARLAIGDRVVAVGREGHLIAVADADSGQVLVRYAAPARR